MGKAVSIPRSSVILTCVALCSGCVLIRARDTVQKAWASSVLSLLIFTEQVLGGSD